MMSRRATLMCYAAYLLAGIGLARFGPKLWDVHPLVATVAASATTLVFIIGHIIAETRVAARRALGLAASRSDDLRRIEAAIEAMRIRAAPPEPTTLPPASAAVAHAAEAVTESDETRRLLELAARVKARCTGASDISRDTATADAAAAIVAAVEVGDAHVLFQPIVQLPTRQTRHFEAFLQLLDDDGQPVPAARFLAACEAAGTSGALDNLLLARVIDHCQRLGDERPGLRVFCNLTETALGCDSFRAELLEFLADSPRLAERLVLEFDAGAAISLSDAAVDDLKRLEQAGCLLSADNADMADVIPLSMHFPKLAFVKIDGCKLAGVDPAIIEALAARGLQIVATRIETEAEAIEVVELGIALGQGFAFGVPRPPRLSEGARLRLAA